MNIDSLSGGDQAIITDGAVTWTEREREERRGRPGKVDLFQECRRGNILIGDT